jgi:hypothetical protein
MPKTTKPTMNIKDLDKIQNFVDREVDLLKLFNSIKTPQDLQDLLSQSNQEIVKEIEKVFNDWCGDSQYVTGSWNSGQELDSDRKGDEYWDWWSKTAWEQLKDRLDKKLTQLRQSNNLKGERNETK